MLPFFVAMIAALLIITYVPALSLWLPVQTNQLKAIEVEQSRFMRSDPDGVQGDDSVQEDDHVQP
jgi:hypothetical protein